MKRRRNADARRRELERLIKEGDLRSTEDLFFHLIRIGADPDEISGVYRAHPNMILLEDWRRWLRGQDRWLELFDLGWKDQIRKFEPTSYKDVPSSYGDPRPLRDYHYPTKKSAIEDLEAWFWMEPNYLTFSDYSGSLVERSNQDVFTDAFNDDHGVHILTGGYGTRGLYIDLDFLPPQEMIDMLRGLENYPLIDEERHSEMLAEAETEAWSSWVSRDFRRAIEQEHGCSIHISGDAFWDDLFDVFREASERSNTYWEDQSDGVWIDVARVAAAVTDEDLERLGCIPEMPDDQRQVRHQWPR